MQGRKYHHIGEKDSVVELYRRITVKSSGLYYVLLISVLLLFFLSFFIRADVGVSAPGYLRSEGERIVFTAPFEGRLSSASLVENLLVEKGDTLFSVCTDQLSVMHGEMHARLRETDTLLSDLHRLLSGIYPDSLHSRYYRAEAAVYRSRRTELKLKKEAEEKVYRRYRNLFEDQLVSLADFEQHESAYRNIRYELSAFESAKRSQWESEVSELEKERRSLRENLSRIGISESESYAVCPAKSVVQNVFQVKNGQYVHQGQRIAELSPVGDLFVECNVKSSDIGLISEGQPVRMMVDAFNYNDWGILEGKVEEIFEDADFVDGTGIYKVYCSIARDYMELSSGYRRNLRRGMAVSARFVVARRSLFSLAFERLSDWLNPEVV